VLLRSYMIFTGVTAPPPRRGSLALYKTVPHPSLISYRRHGQEQRKKRDCRRRRIWALPVLCDRGKARGEILLCSNPCAPIPVGRAIGLGGGKSRRCLNQSRVEPSHRRRAIHGAVQRRNKIIKSFRKWIVHVKINARTCINHRKFI
jgi:hypothetical protein